MNAWNLALGNLAARPAAGTPPPRLRLESRRAVAIARTGPRGHYRAADVERVILDTLRQHGDQGVVELVEALNLTRSIIQKRVASLVQQGLIERLPPPDGRVNGHYYGLTASAEEDVHGSL